MPDQNEPEQGHPPSHNLGTIARELLTEFLKDPLGFAFRSMIYIFMVGIALSFIIGVTRDMIFSLFGG